VQADVSGAWSAGVGLPDTIVAPRLFGGSYSEWPLTILPPVAPGDAGAAGNVAYNVRSAQFGIQFGGEEGQLLPFFLASRARDGMLDRGTVMIAKATRTASYDGAGVNFGPIATGKQLVAVLHVFSVTAGSVTVTVENGPSGFATSVVVGTFTVLTGVGRQVLEIRDAQAVNDYWRFRVSFAGTDYSLGAVAAMETGL
jgi:hypothetical protein